MLSIFKNIRFFALLVLPFLAWLLPSAPDETSADFSPEKVNLALRRTADALLRLSGDSISRIPAVEQLSPMLWRVRIDQPFSYEQLPALLQASLDLYGIQRPYEVAVRDCTDDSIELGYHQLDFIQSNDVPCSGRDLPEACRYIEIAFIKKGKTLPYWAGKSAAVLLVLGGFAAIWFFRHKKPVPGTSAATPKADCLAFGNSRLDVADQILICGSVRHALTFRETKLLRLFGTHPNQLLERDYILQQVWADEGVLVGRSVDVFVSRLRKKLADDPTIGIVAVHGVGYRMETGK